MNAQTTRRCHRGVGSSRLQSALPAATAERKNSVKGGHGSGSAAVRTVPRAVPFGEVLVATAVQAGGSEGSCRGVMGANVGPAQKCEREMGGARGQGGPARANLPGRTCQGSPSTRGQEQASRGPCPCRSGPAGFARYGRGMPAIGPVECMSEAAPKPTPIGRGGVETQRCNAMQVPQRGTNSVTQSRHRGVTEMEPASCHVLSRPSLSVTTFRLQVWVWALVSRPERLPDQGPLSAWPCLPQQHRCRVTKSLEAPLGPSPSPPRWQTLRSRAHTVSSASLSHREGHSWSAHLVTRDEHPPRPRMVADLLGTPAEASTIRCLGLGDYREQTTAKPGRGPTG